MKGLRVGGAVVSQEHGNFIIHDGGATAADVLELAVRATMSGQAPTQDPGRNHCARFHEPIAPVREVSAGFTGGRRTANVSA